MHTLFLSVALLLYGQTQTKIKDSSNPNYGPLPLWVTPCFMEALSLLQQSRSSLEQVTDTFSFFSYSPDRETNFMVIVAFALKALLQ